MVERHIPTISNYLFLFVSDNQRDWDKIVTLFLQLYRRSQHEHWVYSISVTYWQRKLMIVLRYGSQAEAKETEPSFPEYVKVRFDQKTKLMTFDEVDVLPLLESRRRN